MLIKWTYKRLKKTKNSWHISYRIYLKERIFYYDFRFQKVKDVSFISVELGLLVNIMNRLRVFVGFDSEPMFFRRVWKHKRSIYYTNEPVKYYKTHNKIKKRKLNTDIEVKKNIDMSSLGINEKHKSIPLIILIIIFERIKCFFRGSDCSNSSKKT